MSLKTLYKVDSFRSRNLSVIFHLDVHFKIKTYNQNKCIKRESNEWIDSNVIIVIILLLARGCSYVTLTTFRQF